MAFIVVVEESYASHGRIGWELTRPLGSAYGLMGRHLCCGVGGDRDAVQR